MRKSRRDRIRWYDIVHVTDEFTLSDMQFPRHNVDRARLAQLRQGLYVVICTPSVSKPDYDHRAKFLGPMPPAAAKVLQQTIEHYFPDTRARHTVSPPSPESRECWPRWQTARI